MINKFKLAIIFIVLTLIISARLLEFIYWDNKKENFTPYINGVVRPHFRNARTKVENLSTDTNSFFRKMIRKSGLYY